MENIDQMTKRHEAEKEALEKGCSHTKLSKWMDYAWAPGHFAGRVKVCENCGKIIKSDKKPGPMLRQSMDNPPKPIPQEELEEIVKKANST